MLDVCRELFPHCDGLIGAAAPCDYRPIKVASGKIAKTGDPLVLHLVETTDVVATLGASKRGQWLVGFALETEDHRLRALAKLEKKSCDLVVSNGTQAMHSLDNDVEIINRHGEVLAAFCGLERRGRPRDSADHPGTLIDHKPAPDFAVPPPSRGRITRRSILRSAH